MVWRSTTLEPGLWGCCLRFHASQCAPTLLRAEASPPPELFLHTVRLLPGQLVREDNLVQSAVRAELAERAQNSPPLMTERYSMISWEESILIVWSAPGSRLLLNASSRFWRRVRHRSLPPRCWGRWCGPDVSFYQFGGLCNGGGGSSLCFS